MPPKRYPRMMNITSRSSGDKTLLRLACGYVEAIESRSKKRGGRPTGLGGMSASEPPGLSSEREDRPGPAWVGS